jgi:hypothetical protein
MRGTIEKAYRFHRLIAEALRQRDGSTAQILVTEHIEAVKRAWEAYDRDKKYTERQAVDRRPRRPPRAKRRPVSSENL